MASILTNTLKRLRTSNPDLFLGMPDKALRTEERTLAELMRRTSYPVSKVAGLYPELVRQAVSSDNYTMAANWANDEALADFVNWIDLRGYDNPNQKWPQPSIVEENKVAAMMDELAGQMEADELRSMISVDDKPSYSGWGSW